MRYARKLYNLTACPVLNRLYSYASGLAAWLYQKKVPANFITASGLAAALLGLNFLAIENYPAALLCLLLNRLCDILDGMVAKISGITAFGAFFDITADYTSYVLFIWGFILADPAQNWAGGVFLLVSSLIAAAVLLGFALVSGQDYKKLNRSRLKICAWGTVQNADSYAALLLMALVPGYFMPIAVFFGLLSLGKSLLIISGAYYTLTIAAKVRRKHENL